MRGKESVMSKGFFYPLYFSWQISLLLAPITSNNLEGISNNAVNLNVQFILTS